MNTADPLVGRTLADRFEILERIGEGGTGVVYKAKQVSVDRIIAIKVLGAHVATDPSWVKRFHNEARAASRLDHPNTVRLIDFGQTKEGLLFIAMEYLHGRSLRTEIESVGRLPPNRVLRIMSQICASLSEAHNQGIIHRDIKPDNIYLVDVKGAGDYVKVLDFSVAKLDAPDAQVTRAGVVFGTPQYMSPEQGRGIPLDARSDIYAVGVVAYEMLTGKPPFDAKIPTEVVMMHLRDRPAPLTGVPPAVTALVMRALEKDPGQRQQSAEQLDGECQSCLAELFPRQTPGVGVAVGPTPAAPPRAAVVEQKTMMAAEAPRVGAPPPAAPPLGAPPPSAPSLGAPPPSAPSLAEQKTMMAMKAPAVAASSAPPPANPAVAEQKTVMAMEAPRVASSSAPPPAAPPIAEQKTVMGMEAPRMGLQPPPPAPPPPVAPPAVTADAGQKTMMAQPAPQVAQKTMMAQPAPQKTVMAEAGAAGTKILPDSQGVVAYAADRARQARHSASNELVRPPPAGALFWISWVLLGLGVGLGIHFWLLQRG